MIIIIISRSSSRGNSCIGFFLNESIPSLCIKYTQIQTYFTIYGIVKLFGVCNIYAGNTLSLIRANKLSTSLSLFFF